MRYEYTGNLTFNEKVELVSKEIKDKYPKISDSDVKKIAALDNKIMGQVNGHIVFRRLYNILLIIDKTSTVFKEVLKDFIYECAPLEKSETENYIFEDILKFYKGELENFPIIGNY